MKTDRLLQDRCLGIDCCGYLLCHAHSPVYPWVNRLGGLHTVSRLCPFASSRTLSDPYFLRMAEAEEELLKKAHFK